MVFGYSEIGKKPDTLAVFLFAATLAQRFWLSLRGSNALLVPVVQALPVILFLKFAAMVRASAVILTLLAALALQACGTKGPLYLPPPGAPTPADTKPAGTR
jgi:predicted small lipoprotein YifL